MATEWPALQSKLTSSSTFMPRSVVSDRLLIEIAQDEGGDIERAATGDPQSLLKKIDFGAPLKGFAEQFEYARTWGPYADGPVPIGTMWNLTGRAFGTALSGQSTPEEAAKSLLQEIEKQMAAMASASPIVMLTCPASPWMSRFSANLVV